MSSGTFTRACGSRRSSVDRPPAYGNDPSASKSFPPQPLRSYSTRPAFGPTTDPHSMTPGTQARFRGQRSAVQCSAVQRSAVQRSAVQRSSISVQVSAGGDVRGIRRGDRHRLIDPVTWLVEVTCWSATVRVVVVVTTRPSSSSHTSTGTGAGPPVGADDSVDEAGGTVRSSAAADFSASTRARKWWAGAPSMLSCPRSDTARMAAANGSYSAGPMPSTIAESVMAISAISGLGEIHADQQPRLVSCSSLAKGGAADEEIALDRHHRQSQQLAVRGDGHGDGHSGDLAVAVGVLVRAVLGSGDPDGTAGTPATADSGPDEAEASRGPCAEPPGSPEQAGVSISSPATAAVAVVRILKIPPGLVRESSSRGTPAPLGSITYLALGPRLRARSTPTKMAVAGHISVPGHSQ